MTKAELIELAKGELDLKVGELVKMPKAELEKLLGLSTETEEVVEVGQVKPEVSLENPENDLCKDCKFTKGHRLCISCVNYKE